MNKESDTVTVTGLVRLTGLSRDRIKKAVQTVRPRDAKGSVPRYDLGDALRAILAADETPADREARLRGDVLEAKLQRIRGESLNRDDCLFVYKEIIIGLRRVIESSDKLSRADQSRFATYLKHEYSALWDKLRDCRFPEAKAQPEGSNEDDDDDE